jgi:hypothetical protein
MMKTAYQVWMENNLIGTFSTRDAAEDASLPYIPEDDDGTVWGPRIIEIKVPNCTECLSIHK